ncbi:MAG TPA: DUF4837 family protein [Candidatus Cloacimonadota bacterium]|nr:DUF4837 family protein [Candidatus Cloacimonadales bacterium]HPY96969.1 DUF4837 family protein [Candidatus Cloacimonadota bacterium]HQB41509.1 DUF4837 family protein [Candidatus Cloacimonadota bacterium]
MKNKYFIIILIMLSFLAVSCSKSEKKQAKANKSTTTKKTNNVYEPGKPMSWGHDQTIYVFVDDDVWKEAEYYVRYALERPFFTVQNEKLFEVKRGDVKALDQFYKYKNLLFICDFSSNKPVATSVKKMMNKEMENYVESKGSGLFAKHNHWANEQFVVFMIGSNINNLAEFYKRNGNELFFHYRQKFVQRIAHKHDKLKPVDQKLFDKFPFTMQVPENYILYKSDPEGRFISFIWRSREDQKLNPDKYISIYYEPMPKKQNKVIEQEWVKATRKKIAWDYYDEDEIVDEDVQYGLYKFLDYPTWYMSGRWQNSKYFIGGTFQSFGFFDESTKIAYLIDTSVYFPQGDKLKFLMELESIAHSFKAKEVKK